MNMEIVTCPSCSFISLPPKYGCPKCRSEKLVNQLTVGKGEIYSFTTIHIAPEQFASSAPYHLILVELENGLKVTARLQNGRPQIGLKVELVRSQDSIYWFLPAS